MDAQEDKLICADVVTLVGGTRLAVEIDADARVGRALVARRAGALEVIVAVDCIHDARVFVDVAAAIDDLAAAAPITAVVVPEGAADGDLVAGRNRDARGVVDHDVVDKVDVGRVDAEVGNIEAGTITAAVARQRVMPQLG